MSEEKQIVDIDVHKILTWSKFLQDHRTWIFGAVLTVVTLLGGNADRLTSWWNEIEIPDDNQAVYVEKLDKILALQEETKELITELKTTMPPEVLPPLNAFDYGDEPKDDQKPQFHIFP